MFSDSAGAHHDLQHYVAVLWRRKLVIIGLTLLVAAAAAAWSLSRSPVYEATAQVLVVPLSTDTVIQTYTGETGDPRRNLENEVSFFRSDRVRDAAVEELGRPANVRLSTSREADLIEVTGSAGSAKTAALIANTFAQAYVDQRLQSRVEASLQASAIVQAQLDAALAERAALVAPLDDLDAQIAAAETEDVAAALAAQKVAVEDELAPDLARADASISTLETALDDISLSQELAVAGQSIVAREATPPSEPVSPQPVRDIAIGLVTGLVLGIAAAFLIDYLDDSIKDRDDLELAAPELPVLGLIPTLDGHRRAATDGLITRIEPTAPASEAYRALRTSVQFAALNQELRRLLVTSAVAEEGKTTTIANLAVAHAQAGQRVLLVCCDWRRPRLHELFGIDNRRGFTSLLLETGDHRDAIHTVEGLEQLAVIPSGPIPPFPAELLMNPRTSERLDLLSQEADLLLIDAPPVLPVTDAAILSRDVDGVMLVARHGTTRKRQLQRAVEVLRQAETPVLGTVLNAVPRRSAEYYGGDYTYGAVDGAETEDAYIGS